MYEHDMGAGPVLLYGVVFPVRRRWLPYLGGIAREVKAARRLYPAREGWNFAVVSPRRMTIVAPTYGALYEFVAEHVITYDPDFITPDEQIRKLLQAARLI